MATRIEVSGMEPTPSLHVQLGTTMSFTASRPEIHQPQSPQNYGQLASFAVPLSSSSSINITAPMSPPQPEHIPPQYHSQNGEELYASYVPVQPPSPKPDYTSRVAVEPSPPAPPPTKPKPKGHSRSNQSSTGSVTSSGIGSTPSSPRMATSSSSRTDPEADSESFTWSSLDDTRSERSFNSSGGGSTSGGDADGVECDSACSVGSPEVERDDIVSYDRVGLVSEDKIAVIVQLACESDEGTNNDKFTDLVVGVTKAVAQYFRKKEAMQETMNSTQINQLVMADRRNVKEHIAEVSNHIEEAVTVTKADCRRVSSKGYVGTYVLHNVTYKDRAVVAKTGVIVVLRKLNKFACTKEFSEQLSLHILAARPEVLGKKEATTTVDRLAKKNPHYAKALQTQRFYCDQTCNVYEASRRSFVEITDFVLYG